MDSNIGYCGSDCSICEHYLDTCKGCREMRARVWWTLDSNLPLGCPIGECCRHKKQIDHCGLCKQMPCEKFISVVDPSMTEEEHAQSVRERVEFLKSIR